MNATRVAALAAAGAAALTVAWSALCVWAVTADADAELYERDDLR